MSQQNSVSQGLESDAKHHGEMADLYPNHPAVLGSKSNVPIIGSAMHCSGIAKSLREAANDNRQLAAEHEEMAKAAK
ncbi:MAG: hypothetical protein M3Y27_14525 [Acidobacteriota bacterium]|nr:hypothetical protein [Acidobacteriota bacterium]